MNSLLLTGGRVVDPANHFDAVADVLLLDGKVSAVGQKLFPRLPTWKNSTPAAKLSPPD